MNRIPFEYECTECNRINQRSTIFMGEGVMVSVSAFWCKFCHQKLAIKYQFIDSTSIKVLGEVSVPEIYKGPFHRHGRKKQHKMPGV